ncbi:hypothetical protein H2204_008528 [Knufia peltigerae]|uniref:Uncharacterized protein n=1 Tax=Knufia peltigerae TaxID=1002370 RepID=A0AA38Y130_9EURO|nr:hypothetical protein H2204_008528 [Knufia peltigerae]
MCFTDDIDFKPPPRPRNAAERSDPKYVAALEAYVQEQERRKQKKKRRRRNGIIAASAASAGASGGGGGGGC